MSSQDGSSQPPSKKMRTGQDQLVASSSSPPSSASSSMPSDSSSTLRSSVDQLINMLNQMQRKNDEENRKRDVKVDMLEKMVKSSSGASPTSYSEFYNSIRVIRNDDVWFDEGKVDAKMRTIFATNNCSQGKKTEEETQTWMNQRIAAIAQLSLLPKERKKTNSSSGPASQTDKKWKCVMVDRHSWPSFRNRKPDIGCYLSGRPQTEINLVCIGEMKPYEHGQKAFTSEQMGHIFGMMQDLMEAQPWRNVNGTSSVTGFISDGCKIRFLKLSKEARNGYQLVYTETSDYYLHEEGGTFLLRLLQTDPARLGYKLPKLQALRKNSINGFTMTDLTVTGLLGTGGTSVVYECEWADKANADVMVAKCFFSEHKRYWGCERDILQHLNTVSSLKDRVPQLLYFSDDPLFLLVTPKASSWALTPSQYENAAHQAVSVYNGSGPFPPPPSVPNAADFEAFIDILQAAHNANVFHRDVTLANMFYLNDVGPNSVLVNDWSHGIISDASSISASETIEWQGSVSHAPIALLDHLLPQLNEDNTKCTLTRKPCIADDLGMLVACVFHSVNVCAMMSISNAPHPRSRENLQLLKAFWEHHLFPPCWKDMSNAAANGDYKGLKVAIKKLIL